MKYTLSTILLLSHLVSFSQILNVENGNVNADSSNFFAGSLNVKFNINNQSSKQDKEIIFKGLDSKADVIYVGAKNAYILLNQIKYFSSTGGPFISTGYSHFRINWLRKNKISYESFTQAQYDEGRKMPLRWLAGSGIRIKLIDNEKGHIYLGIGAMYELERWKNPVIENALITKEIIKTSDYLKAQLKFDKVSFNSITYYQGGKDMQDAIWRSRLINNTYFNARITGVLSFVTSFTLQYDFAPIIPIPKYTYSLTNGLQINF